MNSLNYPDGSNGKEESYPTLTGDSEIKDEMFEQYKESVKNQSQNLEQLFTEQPIARTTDGEAIINADFDNVWYRDNVFILFMLGCIFDEEDEELLKAALDCFHNDSRTGFLNNKVIIKNYTDPMVQQLEKMVALPNGNYHVCMLPIVYNDAKIDDAPAGEYMKHGIVDKFVSWDDITKYLSETLSKYGLQTKITKDKSEKFNITMKEESQFDLREDIDPEYVQSLETQDEILNMFQKRSRQVSLAKNEGKKYYQRTFQRKKNSGSLMQRIREEENVKEDDSRVSQYKGVELRYNERKMPEEHKETIPMYDIYDNSENFNKVAHDVDEKITMTNELGLYGTGFHISSNTRKIGTFNGITNTFE